MKTCNKSDSVQLHVTTVTIVLRQDESIFRALMHHAYSMSMPGPAFSGMKS